MRGLPQRRASFEIGSLLRTLVESRGFRSGPCRSVGLANSDPEITITRSSYKSARTQPRRQNLGALAGVFTRQSDNAAGLVEEMLNSLRHRGTQTRISVKRTSKGCSIGIGYCDYDEPELHFTESSGNSLTIDGSLLNRRKAIWANYTLHKLASKANTRIAVSDIMSEPGAFSVLFSSKDRLRTFRDPVGFKPLFCAHNLQLIAFASERKALWKLGLIPQTNSTRSTPYGKFEWNIEFGHSQPLSRYDRQDSDDEKGFRKTGETAEKVNPSHIEK